MGSELDPWGPLWGGVIGCFVNAHIPTLRTFSLNDPIVSKLPRPILSSIHCPCKPFPKFNNQTWKNEQGFKKTGQWGTTSFHGPLLTLASLLRWEPFWLLACPLDPLKMVEGHWSSRLLRYKDRKIASCMTRLQSTKVYSADSWCWRHSNSCINSNQAVKVHNIP